MNRIDEFRIAAAHETENIERAYSNEVYDEKKKGSDSPFAGIRNG